MQPSTKYRFEKAGRVIVLATLLFLLSGNSYARESDTQRVWAGLDVFPGLLAADLDITKKRGADGKLLLVLMYIDQKDTARDMARHLEKVKTIRGVPIRIDLSNDALPPIHNDSPFAGIFLTKKLTTGLDSVIEYGKEKQTIVFSPFAQDVQHGVHGGIIISDRIIPHINLETMRVSGIRIKSIFMRIAMLYGNLGSEN